MYDPTQPYPSARSPVVGRDLVATSQPLAAQAGLRALQDGGNAIDAAIATAITLTVVEPNNNGLGSDAFALVWDGERLYGLNASGRSPAGWTPERFAGRTSMPPLGWDTVTVPGAVSAWQALSDRFGALPFARLFEDAIRYARDGYHVGPKTAFYWRHAQRQFADYPDWQAHFCPEGRAPQAGERFVPAHMAETLETIAETGADSFYRGAIAARIAEASAAAGGVMTLEDLDAHEATWVDPLGTDFADATLHEIPPNGQGLGALIALGVLERLRDRLGTPDSLDAVHHQIEASRIGIRDAFAHIADIEAMQISPAALLDPARLDELARGIDAERADPTPLRGGASPDTVYLTAADAQGRAVSLIQSNYLGFGSGIVVPGTGIALQNRGAGFVLEPGHPNCVAPRKRPFHTIIPGFATRDGQPFMSFGVMGGHMQHQGHVQMMLRTVLWGQNPQAAIDAPRWHVREDGCVAIEAGFDPAVADGLHARGHIVEIEPQEHVFGGAQIAMRLADGAWCGGSDPRKEGGVAAR